jgi:hypothetical protein
MFLRQNSSIQHSCSLFRYRCYQSRQKKHLQYKYQVLYSTVHRWRSMDSTYHMICTLQYCTPCVVLYLYCKTDSRYGTVQYCTWYEVRVLYQQIKQMKEKSTCTVLSTLVHVPLLFPYKYSTVQYK